MKLPPYMMDEQGYCYPSTPYLVEEPDLKPWYGAVGLDGYATGEEPAPPWAGQTVVCIASGPSLTQEDCDLVAQAGLPTVATNDSWRRAPGAVILAADHGWWQQHMHELPAGFVGWTSSVPAAEEFDLNLCIGKLGNGNSGAKAIALATQQGARKVLLLGYDCSLKNGTHWHGDHTRTSNPNQGAIVLWRKQFEELAEALVPTGVQVVNCSRDTALECFPLGDLTTELNAEIARKTSQTL